MNRHRATVRANPPANLLYDMKAAARAERWARWADAWRTVGFYYILAGATAGIASLVLEVLRR